MPKNIIGELRRWMELRRLGYNFAQCGLADTSLWDNLGHWFDVDSLDPHNPIVMLRGMAVFAGFSILNACLVGGCKSISGSEATCRKIAAEMRMNKTEVTPEEARSLLDADEGYVYLDVRTIPEFEAGRPPGAINIPLAEPNPATGQMELNPNFLGVVDSRIPRNAKVIVGCQSGGRSAYACDVLRREGYSNVVNMVGGYGGLPGPGGRMVEPGWAALGYPVEKGDAGERNYKLNSKSEARQ